MLREPFAEFAHFARWKLAEVFAKFLVVLAVFQAIQILNANKWIFCRVCTSKILYLHKINKLLSTLAVSQEFRIKSSNIKKTHLKIWINS